MRCQFPSTNSTLVTSLNQSTKIYYQASENRINYSNSVTINQNLAQKYNTSKNYFYQRFINNALKKNSTCKWLINIRNLEPDDNSEHMETYYNFQTTAQQLPSLLQYYKYYGQKAIIFFGKYFKLILSNQQRQKIILYRQLKKVLLIQTDIDDQITEKCNQSNRPFNSTKILKHLIDSKLQTEQSDCFNQLQICMSKFLGRDQPKSLKQIDEGYDKYRKLDQNYALQKFLKKIDQNQRSPKNLMKNRAYKLTNKGSLNKKLTQKSPQSFKRKDKLSLINFLNGAPTVYRENFKSQSSSKLKQTENHISLKHMRHKSNQSLLSTNIEPLGIKLSQGKISKKQIKPNSKNRNKSQGKILKQNMSFSNLKNGIQQIKAKIRRQNKRLKQQSAFGSTQFFNQKKRKVRI